MQSKVESQVNWIKMYSQSDKKNELGSQFNQQTVQLSGD